MRRATAAARSVGGAGLLPEVGGADRGRAGGGIMEDERVFSDICGGRLTLQRRYYSPCCREFCVSCPRLSLRSLTAVTCTVWLAAYGLYSLYEVTAAGHPGCPPRSDGASAAGPMSLPGW